MGINHSPDCCDQRTSSRGPVPEVGTVTKADKPKLKRQLKSRICLSGMNSFQQRQACEAPTWDLTTDQSDQRQPEWRRCVQTFLINRAFKTGKPALRLGDRPISTVQALVMSGKRLPRWARDSWSDIDAGSPWNIKA